MSAHLSHYLSNNQPPSEDHAYEIKAFREKPLEELTAIDAEIERLESTLNSLKLKGANMQKTVDDCNTIIAPIRRLPKDVWSLIFVFCLATHRNSIMSASEAPILLTQVCRDWRSIALSTPRLWSRFYVPFPHESYRGKRKLELCSKAVEQWLRLSGNCPLSISILPPYDWAFVDSQADVILESSDRWQRLELGPLDYDLDLLKRILTLSTEDLPILRDLQIHSTISSRLDEDLWYKSGLFTAYGLSNVAIEQAITFTRGIPLGWKYLNSLFMHFSMHIGLAGKLLRYCSNLAACLLKVEGRAAALPSSFLPHLEFLSLHGEPESCDKLFSSIETPSLQILDCYLPVPTESESSGLFTFLQGIKSLKKLILEYREVNRNTTFKICALTPSLTHLILGHSPGELFSSFRLWCWYSRPEPTKLLAMLYETERPHSPDSAPLTVLFPSLEVFEGHGHPDVTDGSLLEFIMARIDASKLDPRVSKLKKVTFNFSRSREVDIVPEVLDYAKAAGVVLQLELTYLKREPKLVTKWSPSYGLANNDASWPYPRFDYKKL